MKRTLLLSTLFAGLMLVSAPLANAGGSGSSHHGGGHGHASSGKHHGGGFGYGSGCWKPSYGGNFCGTSSYCYPRYSSYCSPCYYPSYCPPSYCATPVCYTQPSCASYCYPTSYCSTYTYPTTFCSTPYYPSTYCAPTWSSGSFWKSNSWCNYGNFKPQGSSHHGHSR